ncbi:MAG: polysaccharide biosynthesis C-terminal domain-containing protein [Lentisphaerales bacterium]|nr:polysaccharide biosynthesis C-terminal domain-containing protein [Lentisphaerales bacterium]
MIKQATLIATSKLFEKAFSFVTIIILTHLFAPKEMGRFFFFFSLVSLLLPFMDFGLKKLFVVRAQNSSTIKKKTLLGTLIVLKLICGFLVLVFSLLLEYIIHFNEPSFLAVSLCFCAVFMEELAQLFRSHDHLKEIYKFETLAPILNKAGCLLCIYCFQESISSIEQALLIFALFCLFGALISLLSLRDVIPIIDLKYVSKEYKIILKEGFPYSITGLFVMVSFYVDSVILGYYSYEQTGTYNAAFRIIIVFGFLSAGLSHVLFAKFSKNKANIAATLNNVIPLITTIFISIAIGVAALSYGLVDLIYNDDYQQAASIMLLLSPFIFLSAFSNIFAHSLEAAGRQKEVMKFNAWTSSFNLIANLLLIPIWGMYAAALTTVCTEFLNTYLSYRCLKGSQTEVTLKPSAFTCFFIMAMLTTGYLAAQVDVLLGAFCGATIFIPLLITQYRLINEHTEETQKCVS